MHEMSLMAGVFDVINDMQAKHDFKKVLKVKLQVGELTNAEPEALEFAFKAFSRDTGVEDAELEIEVVPLIGHCSSCGLEFKIENGIFRCPKCQGLIVDLVSGRELVLESMEVE